MRFNSQCRLLVIFMLCVAMMPIAPAAARTQLKNICRVKGQEEITLRGLGLVVGLNGTGEAGDGPTMRAIAQALEVMGNPLATNGKPGNLDELKKMKNAAMVLVTATIPATGARRGDKINCSVSALNGKSLDGGRLAFASLMGPDTRDKRVYANCEGQLVVDNPEQPMVAVVQDGCQLAADIFTPFVKDGYMTFVLDANHANFQTADLIAQEINSKASEGASYSDESKSGKHEDICYAIDAANIVVKVPKDYREDPVRFASDMLDIKLYESEPEARVVINSRAGSIVISGEVEIGDVVVTHKNVVVEAIAAERFSPIDVDKQNEPKLKQLVDQLNALKVPTADMIEIIRGIDRNGKLHGRLIIE